MNEFPKILLAEFRDHSAHIRVVLKRFDPFKNFRNQTLAYVWDPLSFVPGQDFLKVLNGGFSEREGNLCHRLIAPDAL